MRSDKKGVGGMGGLEGGCGGLGVRFQEGGGDKPKPKH